MKISSHSLKTFLCRPPKSDVKYSDMGTQPDPFEIEGIKRGKNPPSFPWILASLFLSCVGLAVLILTPFPEKLRRKLGLSKAPEPIIKIVTDEKIIEKRIEVENNVAPSYYTPKADTNVAKTSAGFDFKSSFKELSGGLASEERKQAGSYEAQYTLSIKRPRAAQTLSELEAVTPELSKILPGLASMVPSAKVSPFHQALYKNKAERLKSRAQHLKKLLTKHNYYDCQTMLEMQHPESERRIFLMQADMDVVADGSDGDRLPQMPEKIINSTYYQPFTSYGWNKVGSVENPLILGWQKRLEKAKREGGTSSRIQELKDGIEDMQKRSFLIAEYDPFIVIPVYIIRDRESAWGPNVGDYVAVIYQGMIYPAIVGDAGPDFKVGEASLRIARTINSKASPSYRPVSSVGVTYIVFPRTSGDWQAPDYDSWHAETKKLLEEIGGLGENYELHRWENLLSN